MKNKFYFFAVALTLLLEGAGWLGTQFQWLSTQVFAGIGMIALIVMLTYALASSYAQRENPNQFVRGIMGGTFLKFFLSVLAVGIWIFFQKKQLHKPDLYYLMIAYVFYSVLDTFFLHKLSRR